MLKQLKVLTETLALRTAPPDPERQLSRDARMSLLIHFFFQFGASMSGVFLNLYLWRLTESLWINGVYNMINFSMGVMGFVIGGWLAKRKDRMVSYRLGLLLISLFYLFVVIAQEKVASFFVIFALFNGLSSGFYWVGYLVLQVDVSDDRNRIHYLAVNTIFFTAAGLIGPGLAGYIISTQEGLNGYIIVFITAFFMFLLAALFSLKIGPKPFKHKTYYLPHSLSIMKSSPFWLVGLGTFLVMGLLQGIMLFLPNILLFQVIPHEEYIGYLGMLFSAITIGTGMFISKFAKERYTVLYVWISSAGIILAASLLLFARNSLTVISFMILYNLFAPLQGNMTTSSYYRMIGKLPLKGQFRVESLVVRELFLNIGRVISILSLIFLSGGLEGKALPYVLLAGAAVQLLAPVLLRMENTMAGKHERKRSSS